ncbi:MAG: GIY-YIG nuclease family protein [Alphaproteobacteria bacterium]|jgi:putative endonuclease|nr:GIY-YIG nuclease family protein [Alphaproteobacteria bacterium]
MKPCVYILASKRGGTLYIGVTNDIRRRLGEHLDGRVEFTRRYHVKRLVYIEFHPLIRDAIAREKRLKEWNWAWKTRLIEESNIDWNDLYKHLSWLD